MKYSLFILIILVSLVMFACGAQTDYSNYQGPSQDNPSVGGGCGVTPQSDIPLDCSVPTECLLPANNGKL